MKGVEAAATVSQNTICQIQDAVFTKLDIQNAMFMTFAMPQYPTWFFSVLFHNFDLVIDQRHVISQPYEALTQAVNGQMFDCFVDQDVVSALLIWTKETNTLYPNKYMLAWKLAADDLFMLREINETTQLNPSWNQNDFKQFIGTRAYPDPVEVGLTLITHYLCHATVQIMFDDNHDPQLLSLEVIGEMGGSMVRNG
ncbi:MAG: hypothetical protein EZS28_017575 [Streblomastix strix]|uniref:Uncharacterized protein n=1 Tax=Streblomastix strix TaxID=222440 RepID=A0A5J4VW80_9EUKA|nr:MAG: hypothetical protein EZS28_017575 [Streblomastix strix]